MSGAANIIFSLKKIPTFIRWVLMPDRMQRALYGYFKKLNYLHAKKVNKIPIVLVQCVEDTFYFGLFGQIISSIQSNKAVQVEQFIFRCMNVGESRTILFFLRCRFINYFYNYRWSRLYSAFCKRVGYTSTSFQPVGDLVNLWIAWRIYKSLISKENLVELTIDGVWIGDLINDSYIRCKPAPTVDILDGYLCLVIWQALRDMSRSRKYFSRKKPCIYLTSYSVYIQHGIAARVALTQGVHVYVFGNLQELYKKLSQDDVWHTKNPDNYLRDYESNEEKDEKLFLAEKSLLERISGGIDAATSYMAQSAYTQSVMLKQDLNGYAVLFMHDFFDSPHGYRDMIFADFWEWAVFTVDSLCHHNIPLVIKPHPNQSLHDKRVLSLLQKKYPKLVFLDYRLTNKQLVDGGIRCGITVYGTVAGELAFLGVPSITCSHNPHVNFNFCLNSKNKSEYFLKLGSIPFLNIDKDLMKKHSLIFYYSHNLSGSIKDIALRNELSSIRSKLSGGEEINAPKVFCDLASRPAFRDAISHFMLLLES